MNTCGNVLMAARKSEKQIKKVRKSDRSVSSLLIARVETLLVKFKR
jgi:hypothetical protein